MKQKNFYKIMARSFLTSLFFIPLAKAGAVPPVGQAAVILHPQPTTAVECTIFGETPTTILSGALSDGRDLSVSEAQRSENCISFALNHGADPNHDQGILNPLILAVQNNDRDSVQALLKHKANPSAKDDKGLTPVYWAADYQEDDILADLLAAGADPVTGQPLNAAAGKADVAAVKALLTTGKIPVNQLTNYPGLDQEDRVTALDTSESLLDLVQNQVKQDAADTTTDPVLVDSRDSSTLLIYDYPREMLPEFQRTNRNLQQVLQNQTEVSRLLKQAGWTCAKPNCGIDKDMDSDYQAQ